MKSAGERNYPAGTALTNRVAIWQAITVRSANNDPTNTIIKGAWDPATANGPAAVRCVWMTNGASLIGFMLTNGATETNGSGGGVRCQSTSTVISNCVIAGNLAYNGGGVQAGTLYNCTLTGNSASNRGGGAHYGTLYNCTLTGNRVHAGSGGGLYACSAYYCTFISNSAGTIDSNPVGWGGGAHAGGQPVSICNSTFISNSASDGGGVCQGVLSNCTLTGNSANNGGGGDDVSLYNCTLSNNVARRRGGGMRYGTITNCLIIGNRQSESSYEGGGGVYYGTLYNCTVVGNSAATYGGGVCGGSLIDSIVYFNTAATGGNWYNVTSFTNCCTTTAQVGWATGNITNDPAFITNGSGYGTSHVAGNYRLRSDSPCVNTGTNISWTMNSLDLDGRMRIRYGIVDMGAYETIYEGTIITFP